MSKKVFFPYKKERVILSDILPYEVPLIFSNRSFYRALVKYKIDLSITESNYIISWDKNTPEYLSIYFSILFGKNYSKKLLTDNKIIIKDNNPYNIPYTYNILHKKNRYRELSIIHPFQQELCIDFYNKYKDLMLYYTNLSNFSLRKPVRISKFTYYKDAFHLKNFDDNPVTCIEEDGKDYENIKSFFVYKKYGNIYKFYESSEYLKAEFKFSHLIKMDISSCFDSIYTHSIAWAVYGKEYVKKYLTKIEKSFPGMFDKLVRNMNHKQTNGILIGPEFSRIFAEIILQSIDVKLENKFINKKLYNKRDYQIFRYIDDYFIFYNDIYLGDEIIKELGILLKDFNLHFNDSKREDYDRPIITNLSITKEKIKDLLEDTICYNLEKMENDDENNDIKWIGNININSNKMKTKFRTILLETSVEYSKILSFTMYLITANLNKLLKKYKQDTKKNAKIKHVNLNLLIIALNELIDFTFFIYSMCPRVSYSIKLCQFLGIILNFVKDIKKDDYKNLIFKSIYDKIYSILKQDINNKEFHNIETLYLFIILKELGSDYLLPPSIVTAFKTSPKDKNFYWSVMVLLFYIQNLKQYSEIKKELIEEAIKCIKDLDLKETKRSLLSIDILSCPYIESAAKEQILKLYSIPKELYGNFLNSSCNWFIKWNNFNFKKEVDNKIAREVY